MRKLRKILTLCIALLMVMQVVLPTISQAVDTVKLNIQNQRPYNDNDGDGTVGNDIYTLVRQAIQTVFKIGEQDENGSLSFNIAYYCLRGGLGFGSTEEILANGVDYTKLADLSDSNSVMEYFKNTIGYDMPEENYNAILWIVDNMYLPKSEYANEMKQDLLNDAGITSSELTDDDIEVVQQIALWYFTNYDENGEANSVSLSATTDLANLLQINSVQPNNDLTVPYNKNRASQINMLYKYFIENATEKYEENKTIVAEKLELDKTLEPSIETKIIPGTTVNAYVVGPFKINEVQKGSLDYVFSYTLKYKTSDTQTEWTTVEIDNTMGTVYLSDENGTALDRTKDIEDMIAGDEFYITMLKDVLGISNIEEFGIDISHDTYYYNTYAEVLIAEVDDQPVLKVEKERVKDPGSDSITVQKEEEPQKDFDLSLRKFITGINGEELTGEISRVPTIYLEYLRNGTETTATYEHPKTPVYLKRGDIITYTIRIYNEGELDGYAKEVTDYLCDGLELVENSTINEKYNWVLAEDGKTLTTDYLANTLIKAYDGTVITTEAGWQKSEDGEDGLYYADFQIECRIKETATVGINLPNVAEISDDLSEGTTDIEDRDSTPESLTDDDVRNYENNPWYEDDDDYERVIIEPDKVFDLSLRKYITKVNDIAIENNRVPEINVSALDAGTSTTAEYNHRKDPIVVKPGDLVTYNLSIYNEGEATGRATKIVDQLPTGLEFIEVKSGNYELESYNTDTNRITLKETTNNTDLIAKQDGEEPTSTTIEIVCKITAKVAETDQVLTNVAWIAEDYNADNNQITDRDSKPQTTPEVNKDNMADYVGKGNKEDLSDADYYYKGQEDDDDFEKVVIKGKEFDLSLRKYITHVNHVSVLNRRIPNIDVSALDAGISTTAEYNHRKDPVEVKTGDLISYNLAIYNEGEISGRATKVVDQLPTGLEFIEVKPGNYELESYDKDLNKVTLKENSRNINLDPHEEGRDPRVTIIEIVCKVTAKVAETDQVLTNVAWIAEDYNAENDEMTDRDSKPETTPEVNKDNMADYVGKENKEDLSDSDYYYKGQEDDDDFEKIVIRGRGFDLSLRKYITKVNGVTVTNTRIPEINSTGLNEGTSTTAEYNHRKDPVEAKTGDLVTYNLTIYNEGEVLGRATKVVDQLPTGLEFVEVKSENYELESYDKDLNKVTLKETTLNMNLDPYEEGRNLQSTTIEIVCKVTAKVTEIDQVLTNVAWIAQDYNAENSEITDRDSKPETTPEVNKDNMVDYAGKDNKDELADNEYYYKGQEDDDDFEKVVIRGRGFDLSLRKYITKVNDVAVAIARVPNVDVTILNEGTSTTAEYNHRKEPVEVKTGDLITYNLTIYNEGEILGRATKVVDQLPTGLEFVEVKSENYELESYDKDLNKVTLKETTLNMNLEPYEEGGNLQSTTIEIVCKVTGKMSAEDEVLTNVAWIAEYYNAENDVITDRDSDTETTPEVNKDNMTDYTGKDNKEDLTDGDYYYKGQEDDDDFEKVIIKTQEFDLALRKYISNVERKGRKVNFSSRVPEVDTTPLQEGETTANYNHAKDILTVKQGDIITYKLRIYNEGHVDGYVTEITDYIPDGLGFLNGYSGNSNWLIDTVEVEDKPLVGETGFYKTENDVPDNGILKNEDLSSITIVTGKGEGDSLKIKDYISLRDELIKKYGAEIEDGDLYQESVNDENDGLFYQEVDVTCIVLAPNTCEDTITNIAEISKDKAVDDLGEEVEIEDRDSNPESLTEEERKDYENNPWYEDDDDYEPVQLKYFDLALRKFITGVNETEVNTRVPEVKISEEGKITYVHTKTPIKVVDNDNVTYTIRVYNEGTIAGYAEEIEDDIPEGLVFLPDDATNKEYGWKMYFYDEDNNLVETDDVEKATVIRTNYLSEANGTINEETGKNGNLLEAFDKKTMDEPDYRDIKVVFNVSQEDIPEENVSGIVENKAHITEDSEDDEDSIPDEWNDGEDDQDKEYIYVQKFDLALFKWVSQTIVTVDGKTTTTETGFKPNVGKTEQEGDDYRNNEDEEPIASVTIDKKKINSTVVKFVYNIKVVNEGELPGYATEITDYIPEGLKFVQEDNPLWTLNEGNKITTRALETKLLEPGESAEVQVVFTWINDANNLGVKTNIAAITEDYNDKGVEDDDSTPSDIDLPNYEDEQEDDDDFALVILTLKTGKETTYIWLIFLTVTIISIGVTLIKKYVL